ncbi:MAG: transcriptional repressor [Thermodesulfobacteriota bacterium]
MTYQRQVILETLRELTSHPTVDEIFQLIRRRAPRISLATVYRNLEILAESGLVRKIELAGQQKRFDGTMTPHHHVRCEGCGRVGDVLADCELPDLTSIAQCGTDFALTGCQVVFSGRCPHCQAAGAEPDPEDQPASPIS